VNHVLVPAFLVLLAVAAPAVEGPVVTIQSPSAAVPAYGTVTIVAKVQSGEPVARVSVLVDGRLLAELFKPPFAITTVLGEDNVIHRFRVVARTASGVIGEAEVVTPDIRADEEVTVELRQLYLTVGRKGERVLDLERGDFMVRDNGAVQELQTFARGDAPLAAVVLVDASLSMTGARLQAALDGAGTFFRGMAPLDEGRLIVFSDRVLHLTPFTNVGEVLLAGLGGISARGGTALNDQLYLGIRQVDERQGRRVIILLSDGVDSHSILSMRDVRRQARTSQAIVYWIRLRDLDDTSDAQELPALYSTWRDKVGHRREFKELAETVVESGGRIVPVASIDRITPAFADIMRELRQQYVLGYYPSERMRDGSWHNVRVDVDRRGLTVNARDGYLDY